MKTGYLYSDKFLLIYGMVILALVPLLNPGMYILHVIVMGFIWAITTASWDLLCGYAGQYSFGHAGFFGLGAYFAGLSSLYLGISPWLGLFISAILTAIIGFFVGIPSLKLKGPYLALVTLGFSETARLVLVNWTEVTRGPQGIWGWSTFPGLPMPTTYVTKAYLYYIALILLVVSCFIMYKVGKSSIGLTFKAIREDETLAECVGINITFFKLLAFTMSTFFAGLAGGFFAYYYLILDPAIAMPWRSAFIVLVAVVGGRGTIIGPVLGAIILEILYEFLRVFGIVYNLIALSLILMVVMIFFPRGFAGLLELRHKKK